jgi:hypothetical protein
MAHLSTRQNKHRKAIRDDQNNNLSLRRQLEDLETSGVFHRKNDDEREQLRAKHEKLVREERLRDKKPWVADINRDVKIETGRKVVVTMRTRKVVYEGDMAERERIAQQEIQRKKTQVAITVNKGAYQYVGGMSADDAKMFGRK